VFIEGKDDGGGSDNWTTGAISRVKFQSNHHQQTNIQLFTGQMPFLSPNQQRQSTEGKNITFYGLAYSKLTWGLPTLSLTTNSSWLPWGRVAMPLISPLMPVPQHTWCIMTYIKQFRETTRHSYSYIRTTELHNLLVYQKPPTTAASLCNCNKSCCTAN